MRNSINSILIIFILVILGCRCATPPQRTDETSNQTAPSTTRSISPTSSPTPLPKGILLDLKDPQLMDKVSKGERVYKRIEAKYNFPIMFGWQARDITLMIPTKDWNGLSKEEKVNLTYYAQKLVIDIKENPKPYVDRWTRYYKVTEQLERGGEYDGLTQNSYIQAAADVCSVCWSITNGTVKGKAFYDDETVVKGDNVQEFRDSMGK